MTANKILHNAATRPAEAAERLRASLSPEVLNAHLGGHDNSVAWLLWHTGRELDFQTADLAGRAEVWSTGGFADRTGLGPTGDAVGVGHSPDEARAIRTDHGDALVDYIAAATEALLEYVSTLTDEDLDQIIDANWDPPVSRSVRLVSMIDDAAQHVGQAAYVVGALTER